MVEQGFHTNTRPGDISSVSLAIQQLVGTKHRSASEGVERSLSLLSQYALAATDITRLLEKGARIISEALPLACVLVTENGNDDVPFCIRAIMGSDSGAILSDICDHRQAHASGLRSTTGYEPEIHPGVSGRHSSSTILPPSLQRKRRRMMQISGKQSPFGWLITEEKDRRLTDDEVQILREAADILAIAIDRIQVQQESTHCEKLAKLNLENRIEERSAELAKTNARLAQSIEQYKKTEEALRRSEQDLHSLSVQLIEVGEQERKRIACELHDSIGQTMSSIKFRLESALIEFGNGAMEEGVATVSNVIPVIQQAIQEVRRISMDLRPSMLDDIGILATIEWYCKEYQDTYQGIRVMQHIDVEEIDIAEKLKLVICRVMQEAMHNIAQHSNANIARLELRREGRRLELRIIDNGNGFSLTQRSVREPNLRGLGLRSMRERVEQTMGMFFIDSRPGIGTTIEATWPLDVLFSVSDQPLLHSIES